MPEEPKKLGTAFGPLFRIAGNTVSLMWKMKRLELKDSSSEEKYVDKVLQMRET